MSHQRHAGIAYVIFRPSSLNTAIVPLARIYHVCINQADIASILKPPGPFFCLYSGPRAHDEREVIKPPRRYGNSMIIYRLFKRALYITSIIEETGLILEASQGRFTSPSELIFLSHLTGIAFSPSIQTVIRVSWVSKFSTTATTCNMIPLFSYAGFAVAIPSRFRSPFPTNSCSYGSRRH